MTSSRPWNESPPPTSVVADERGVVDMDGGGVGDENGVLVRVGWFHMEQPPGVDDKGGGEDDDIGSPSPPPIGGESSVAVW